MLASVYVMTTLNYRDGDYRISDKQFLMCPHNNMSYFHYYVSFLFIIAFLLSDDVPESMPGSEEFLPIGI